MSTEIALIPAENPEHGDFSTNIALKIAKEVGKSPSEIAVSIAQALAGVEGVERASAAGPGFVNITLTPSLLFEALSTVRGACNPSPVRKGEPPVIVEYSHPNIAKPLGVHHILSTVLGQSIANIYQHLGYPVVRWNYIGDWGTQFGKLAVALEKWGVSGKDVASYTLEELLALYVRFHDEAEANPLLEEEGRAAFRKLEEGDAGVRGIWKVVVATSLAALDDLYDRLHISFDITKGESAYEGVMAPIVAEGKAKGIFVSGKEGALVVQFPEGVDLPPFMILKSDGGTLYSTRDLALARDRKDSYRPSAVLHVVDTAQELHFRQLFATMQMLGWEMGHEQHIVYGRMSFPEKGMSTRKGNILGLEEALDEAVRRADALIQEKESDVTGQERQELAEMIGTGAFVYGMLNQNRKHNIVFTWERAMTFEGNSGPYLQYTHARARSVLRKAEANNPSLKAAATLESHERELVLCLQKFPAVLRDARRDAMPHTLTNYLYALCQAFNAFYNDLPILKAEDGVRQMRLALTLLTADVLKVGAELLTLRVPDRM